MSQKTLPKVFKCKKCTMTHQFTPYVYAHWDIPLVFTCPNCEQKHNILRGKVYKDESDAN